MEVAETKPEMTDKRRYRKLIVATYSIPLLALACILFLHFILGSLSDYLLFFISAPAFAYSFFLGLRRMVFSCNQCGVMFANQKPTFFWNSWSALPDMCESCGQRTDVESDGA